MRRNIIFFTLWLLYLISVKSKKTFYIVTERPILTYTNPKYISFMNISSVRKNRNSPMYYVDMHMQTVVPFDDNFKVDFYIYQFLSNEYKRSFVEMHYNLCSLIHKDPFFGATMNQGKLTKPCPYPPGDYHMFNMSIPSTAIPPGFPFEKGRIYGNMTHRGNDIISGQIDMELKVKTKKDQI